MADTISDPVKALVAELKALRHELMRESEDRWRHRSAPCQTEQVSHVRDLSGWIQTLSHVEGELEAALLTERPCEQCRGTGYDGHHQRCGLCDGVGRRKAASSERDTPPPTEPPLCGVCGKPAACFGLYDDPDGDRSGDPDYACDSCCGHGCEDGKCDPIADPASCIERRAWNCWNEVEGIASDWQCFQALVRAFRNERLARPKASSAPSSPSAPTGA